MPKFETPKLPYAFDALEPHIDAKTMKIHHDKHHVAYTTKLNMALENHTDLFDKTIEEILSDLFSIPEDIRPAVRNNGGGHLNHELFWASMTPNAKSGPEGTLKAKIEQSFESVETFKAAFEEKATTQFGSGWAWLTLDGDKLIVESTSNQDTPLSEGRTPLLGLDVWEHAYYLKYQNKRPDYVSAFWNVVNWDVVAQRLQAAS